jgi:hypothetical protein
MAGASLRDTYVELLLERVRNERFPNPEYLDRIEASIQNPEQAREYVDMLFRWAAVPYPSGEILDRIERLVAWR